jgi:hypothetical protein
LLIRGGGDGGTTRLIGVPGRSGNATAETGVGTDALATRTLTGGRWRGLVVYVEVIKRGRGVIVSLSGATQWDYAS